MNRYGDDPWINTWSEVTRAYEVVRVGLEKVAREQVGMPLPWVEVLIRLRSSEGSRVRMTDLACSVGFSDSGISRLIDRMEQSGLVTRELCRTDRRGTEAVLTDAGRAALQSALEQLSPVIERELSASLSAEDVETLTRIMSRVGSVAPAVPA